MKGKLIVIEGSDGSGKTTQLNMLKDYLESLKLPVKTIDFPRYYDSFYGKMVGSYIRGEYGSPDTIDPHLSSMIFALDRAQAREEMGRWLERGEIVLCNRYATSNIAHQSTFLSGRKKQEFISWLIELEYMINKIPQEDLVLYLYVPYEVSLRLMRNKDRENRGYINGKKDMLEASINYLKKSEKSYLDLVDKFPHWVKIDCAGTDNKMKSKERIHRDVVKILLAKGYIK